MVEHRPDGDGAQLTGERAGSTHATAKAASRISRPDSSR
jgi:hypothetical protein